MTTHVMRRIAGARFARLLPVAAAVGLALAFPEAVVAAASFAARSLIAIAPVIVLAILVTAAITASGSMALIAASFAGRETRMIVLAALVGAVAPVCGVSVLPLVAGLLSARVPLAPIMAFWLSSPVTDPGMLAVTAATLGWPFALAKTSAAFGIGMAGGLVVLVLTRSGRLAEPMKPAGTVGRIAALPGRTCGASSAVNWRFWRDRERIGVFFAVVRSTGMLMLLWLAAAFVGEYFMRLYVPDEAVAALVGRDTPWAVPLAALVGAPVYLDGYAALPLVRGLLDGGMDPGAAMAFLVAGGIISAWAALPVFALVRRAVFALYVGLAVTGAMLAGWLSGLVLG